ncbi:MAG TPA: hypothetical protein VFZ56_02465 [Gemmatimonadaceae bacterium]
MSIPPRLTRTAPGKQSGRRAGTIAIWAFVILEAIGIGLVLWTYWRA